MSLSFLFTVCWIKSSTEDSDLCLQSSASWEKYTCETAKRYCTGWQKDMWRCCPQTCEQGVSLTEADCKRLSGSGTCTYPFRVEPHKCSLDIGNKEMKN